MASAITSNKSRYNPLSTIKKEEGLAQVGSGIRVVALRIGQHGGLLRAEGEEFNYKGKLEKDGSLPTWMGAVDEKAYKKEVADALKAVEVVAKAAPKASKAPADGKKPTDSNPLI